MRAARVPDKHSRRDNRKMSRLSLEIRSYLRITRYDVVGVVQYVVYQSSPTRWHDTLKSEQLR